jgi:hypothetical protein
VTLSLSVDEEQSRRKNKTVTSIFDFGALRTIDLGWLSRLAGCRLTGADPRPVPAPPGRTVLTAPRRTAVARPAAFVPYFLYPLPREWILDLLHGRLVILSLLNIGRLAAELEAAGLKTSDSGGHSYLNLLCEVEADGERYVVELPGISDSVTEMIMEMPPSYVTRIARVMAAGIAEQFPMMLRDEVDGQTT